MKEGTEAWTAQCLAQGCPVGQWGLVVGPSTQDPEPTLSTVCPRHRGTQDGPRLFVTYHSGLKEKRGAETAYEDRSVHLGNVTSDREEGTRTSKTQNQMSICPISINATAWCVI